MLLFIILYVLPVALCYGVNIEKLAFQVDALQEQNEFLQNQVKALQQQNEMLEKQVAVNGQEIQSLKENKESMNSVGFFAHLTSDQTLEEDDTVIFDTADVNLGSHYNTETGEFTCPVNGLYFFAFQLQGSNDGRTWTAQIRIRATDNSVRGAGATFFHPEWTHSSTANGVVLCSTNERVFVRNEIEASATARAIYDTDGQSDVWQSYFSGFLVALT